MTLEGLRSPTLGQKGWDGPSAACVQGRDGQAPALSPAPTRRCPIAELEAIVAAGAPRIITHTRALKQPPLHPQSSLASEEPPGYQDKWQTSSKAPPKLAWPQVTVWRPGGRACSRPRFSASLSPSTPGPHIFPKPGDKRQLD